MKLKPTNKKKFLLAICLAASILCVAVAFWFITGRFQADTIGGRVTLIPTDLAEQAGTVWGTLTDTKNRPLDKVKIAIGGMSTVSDASGAYSLSGVHPGTYSVTFSRNGAMLFSDSATEQNLVATGGATEAHNFVLSVFSPRLASGLIAHYTFEETDSKDAIDFSGQENHAASRGTATRYAASPLGRARTFDGTGYIEAPTTDTLTPSNGVTLMAWLRIDKSWKWDKKVSIIDKMVHTYNQADPKTWESGEENVGGYRLFLNNAKNKINFHVLTLDKDAKPVERFCETTSKTIPLNQWISLASTYDGKVIKIYINGEEACSKDYGIAQKIKPSPIPLNLGRHAISNRDYFKGLLDEVRIYGSALSAEEVKKLTE